MFQTKLLWFEFLPAQRTFFAQYTTHKHFTFLHTLHDGEQQRLCGEHDDFWTPTCSVRHLTCDLSTCTHTPCAYDYACHGVGAKNIGMSSFVKCWLPTSFTFQVSWSVLQRRRKKQGLVAFSNLQIPVPLWCEAHFVKKLLEGHSFQTAGEILLFAHDRLLNSIHQCHSFNDGILFAEQMNGRFL